MIKILKIFLVIVFILGGLFVVVDFFVVYVLKDKLS